MNYSKEVKENLISRAELLGRSETDTTLQSLIYEMCSRDVLYFFNNRLWTYDPRLDYSNIPFVTYWFQDRFILDIIDCILQGKDNITEKSRDMGYSWMMLGIFVWWRLFHGWSVLIWSYKEDYVDSKGDMDSSFERMRFMLQRLPSWLKPIDLEDKYMSLSSNTIGSSINGDAGQYFGTGGRRKVVWMDEFSMRQFDNMAFRKTKDLTNCRCFGGTPHGRFNVYGKIMTNHKDYSHLSIEKFRLHRSSHPKKDQAWYEEQKKKRTKIEIAQELDISYDDSVTGAVYPDYRQLVTVWYSPFDIALKTYTSRDFGLDTNALIIWQKNFRTNRLQIISSVQRVNRDLRKFAAFVTGKPTPNFTYTNEDMEIMQKHIAYKPKYAGHFGDPYNADSRSTVSRDDTIRTVLEWFGIYIETKRGSTVADRIRKSTLALSRISVSDDCVDLNQSLTQSKYPQVPEWSQRTSEQTKPIHDENSHFRTAFEYFIDNEPEYDESLLSNSGSVEVQHNL